MTSRARRPLPSCPARQGTSTFGVLTADFILDVRDTPPPDGDGAAITEIVGYFRPPGLASTDLRKEPDLIAVAGLEIPAGSPVSRLAWQAFTSRSGPATVGQLLRAAIIACPCTFPAAGCAALDECILLRAIELAAGRPPSGLTHPGRPAPAEEGHPRMTDLPLSAASPPATIPLVTTGPHPLADGCPVACLNRLLSPRALNPLLVGSQHGQPSAAAELARPYRARTLGQVRGICLGRTTEIEDRLLAAGLVTRGIPVRAGIIELADGQRVGPVRAELEAPRGRRIRTDRVRQLGRAASAAPDVSQWCGNCGRGIAAVLPSGDVTPCVMSRWLAAGNVRDMPLAEILSGPALAAATATIPAGPRRAGNPGDCEPSCAPSNDSEICPPPAGLACGPDCTPASGDSDSCPPPAGAVLYAIGRRGELA